LEYKLYMPSGGVIASTLGCGGDGGGGFSGIYVILFFMV
jgi:hypothetical protein